MASARQGRNKNGNVPAVRREQGEQAALREDIRFLKNIRLFASLTDKELVSVVGPKVRFREFQKNQTILREEDTSEYMYAIIRGKVKIFRAMEEGREMILTMHSVGEFFGEMSLIDGETAPATVSAIEPSVVAIISRSDFYALLVLQRKVLENLLHILCERLRDAWKKIQMLNMRDASDRVKMLFLMLAKDLGEKSEEGTVLNVKLIHQDIADMTGLTRETVTRVMDRWKRSGEIRILPNKSILLTPEFESITL